MFTGFRSFIKPIFKRNRLTGFEVVSRLYTGHKSEILYKGLPIESWVFRSFAKHHSSYFAAKAIKEVIPYVT